MKASKSIKAVLDREFLREKELKALSALHSGELSALEAYELAIDRIKSPELIPLLERCRNSHRLRMNVLGERMSELGKEAENSAGFWGALSNFAEASATLISDRFAITVLAAGEEFGLEQYNLHMKDLDPVSFELCQRELLPAQCRTLENMTLLCAALRDEESKAVQ